MRIDILNFYIFMEWKSDYEYFKQSVFNNI